MSVLQDSLLFESVLSDEILPDSLGVELYQHTLSSANDAEINRKFGKGRSPGRPRKPTTQELEAKVPTLFQDKSMSHAMRESLAISIMRGTHELSHDNNNTWSGGVTCHNNHNQNKNDKRNNFTYNPKLRYNEPSFISVESSSAIIPPLSPKKVIERYKHKKIHDDGRSKIYTWAGKAVSQVNPGFDPFPKHRPATVDANIRKINRTKSLANASKLYKDLDKRRTVETVKQIKDLATEEKKKKYEGKSKEVEIRKRYNEFRKRLKVTLQETRNPQTAEILKCIDDSMIHHFVSKYKGMVVTIDAIVSFLVKSIGSSGAVTPMDGRDIHPSMRHRLGWVPTTGVYSNSRLTNALASATPNFEVAPWEYIGAKLNENPDPNATYYLDDEDVNILNKGLSKFPNWGVRVGTANSKLISRAQEVLSPPPSQQSIRDDTKKNSIKSPWGTPKSSPYVTIASGFRAKTAEAEEGQGYKSNGLEDSNILLRTTIGDDSLAINLNDSQIKNSMSVSQSAILSKLPINYYDEMTSPKQFPPGDPTDPFTPKVGANDTEEDLDPEIAAKIAIDTVQNQMVEEGTLPSIQPIRAISNTHVIHLGEGVETFDTIAEKMDLAAKYGMKSTDDEDEGGAIGSHISSISNNAGPKAIKTKQGLENPRMPYKLGDEVGHILTYGIAAGAGYSLIKSDSKVGGSNVSGGNTRGLLRRGNSASTTKRK